MRAGNCRHFNGIINSTCDAGIAYDGVRDKSQRPYRLPCLTVSWRNKTPEPCATTCAKFNAVTASEEAAYMREVSQSMARVLTARKAIVDKIGPYRKGHDSAGEMGCPVCATGKLLYTRSGYNGHIHAACSTADCVRWME